VISTLLTMIMGVITILFCSRFPEGLSAVAVLQTTALISVEVAILMAITYLFAVNSGGITTAVLTLVLFVAGHSQDVVSQNLQQGDALLWNGVRAILPNLEIFNIKNLASYGQTLPWDQFGIAVLYGATCIGFYLILAMVFFDKKDIAT